MTVTLQTSVTAEQRAINIEEAKMAVTEVAEARKIAIKLIEETKDITVATQAQLLK